MKNLLVISVFLISTQSMSFDGIVFKSKVTQLRYFAEKIVDNTEELEREIAKCTEKLSAFEAIITRERNGILHFEDCKNSGNEKELSISGAIYYPNSGDEASMIMNVSPENI